MVASPLRLDRLPLVKSIDRKNAAPLAIGVAKQRQLGDGLVALIGLRPPFGSLHQ